MSNSIEVFGWLLHANPGLMPFHIQLAVLEFHSYTATTKGSCNSFCCVYCILRLMLAVLKLMCACLSLSHFSNGQFMLVDTCSSRSGNQYSTAVVSWDIRFNMTISSFSSSCISFVVVIVVVTVFISFMYTH